MKTLFEFIRDEKVDIDQTVLKQVINILEKEWVYLTEEIVVDMMGYKKSGDVMRDFYKKLRKETVEGIDYKQVTANSEIVKNHNNSRRRPKLHYLITSKTLIVKLMRANTILSLRYVEHFYNVHDLMIRYYKNQSEEQELNFKRSLAELIELPHVREYAQRQGIKYLDLELQYKGKVGLIYFIHEESNTRAFKVGFTTDLKTRLDCLQISNLRKLLVYKTIYATHASVLENIIHAYLKENIIRGEWYEISKEQVDAICQLYDV